MSNTQFVFINYSDIPSKEHLQEVIDQLGYDLKLNPELSLTDDEGFSPCVLNGEFDVGFELLCEPTPDVVEDDKEFEEMTNGKDTCISISWGSSFKDCSCVLIVSFALMKEYGAITTYEGEELDTLDSLQVGINEALEEAAKETCFNNKSSGKPGSESNCF